MQTILEKASWNNVCIDADRTHTFPPAVTSKPVAVDTSLTCISWATKPFTCKHNKNGVGSSLRVHFYRSARTHVLKASVVECQSTCTWKLIYSIGTQLTSQFMVGQHSMACLRKYVDSWLTVRRDVNLVSIKCQLSCQSSTDWVLYLIDTQLQMPWIQWSDHCTAI